MKDILKVPAHDPRFYFSVRSDSDSDLLVIREIWCENVYEVFDGDLTDTGIVVDLGANIGAFSLYAAKLGAKKVIAVEPEPHNVELLRKNVADNQNNVPDCVFIVDERGVADKNGVGYIDNNHGDSRVSDIVSHNSQPEYSGKKRIEVVSLDQLFKSNSLEYIDVLKIDIEGLEGAVILGASEATLNLCRYITIEYDQYSKNLGAIVEKLSATHQIKYVGSNGGMLFAKRY